VTKPPPNSTWRQLIGVCKSFFGRSFVGWLAALYLLLVVTMQLWLLPSWENSFTKQTTVTTDVSGSPARLIVVHPESISAKPTPDRAAIAAWVVKLTATTPPITVTPSPTPSPSPVAGTPTVSATSLGASSPTNTITATPSPTEPVYELYLTSSAGLAVVMSSGILAPGPALVTSAPAPATPVLFYLEPGNAKSGDIEVTVRDVGTVGGGAVIPFEVLQEPTWKFIVRRFLATVTDPLAIAAALLAGIVGYLISRPFKQAADRKEAIRTGLAALKAQAHEDWISTLKQYLELRTRRDYPWDTKTAVQSLTNEWRDMSQKDKGDWAVAYTRLLEQDNWMSDPTDATSVIVQACRRGDNAIKNDAYRRFGELLDRVANLEYSDDMTANKTLTSIIDVMMNDPDQAQLIWDAEAVGKARERLGKQAKDQRWEEVTELLRQVDFTVPALLHWPRPSHWREQPSEIPSAIVAGLTVVGLKRNPFGPEFAEGESRLADFKFTESLKAMATPQPMVIYGANGTGKTASALLLAAGRNDNQPFDESVFPVIPTFADHLDLPMSLVDWLDVISTAFARCQVRFLGANPNLLNSRAAQGRYRPAVLRFLVRHYGSIEGVLDAYARENSDATAFRAATEDDQPFAPFVSLSVEERISVLHHTIPPGLKYAFVILDQDLPDRDIASPTVVDNLQSLQSLALKLAHWDIFLKVYLPREVKEKLASVYWVSELQLTWCPDQLRSLLYNRFNLVGLGSFNDICEPGDLEDLFIEKCLSNPRRMIRLGNCLLERMGRSSRERISEADICEAADEVERAG
jgi:hypothetical protein